MKFVRYTQVKFGVGSQQVTGGFGNLRALKNLQHLCLTSTQVTGDISSINLYKTQVTGEFSKMRALTNLQTRGLHKTQVTGDIVGLRGLMNLEMLWTYWLL